MGQGIQKYTAAEATALLIGQLGFDVIADEAQKILKEENAEPKTTTDGGDKT